MFGERKEHTTPTSTESSALASKGTNAGSSKARHKTAHTDDPVRSEYCHRPYHTQETCWKLHGKPADRS
ncbi:hypothetical protein F511_00183 [Dorcoceras hygrometricum]|nr:hypothetical protein F511_00183 [Dorcoceras hygrometricum]